MFYSSYQQQTQKTLSQWFWNSNFWLPPNLQWQDIQSDYAKGLRYPESRDLWTPIYVSCFILIIRWFFERYIAYPLGRYYDLSDKPRYVKKRQKRNSITYDKIGQKPIPKLIANGNGIYPPTSDLIRASETCNDPIVGSNGIKNRLRNNKNKPSDTPNGHSSNHSNGYHGNKNGYYLNGHDGGGRRDTIDENIYRHNHSTDYHSKKLLLLNKSLKANDGKLKRFQTAICAWNARMCSQCPLVQGFKQWRAKPTYKPGPLIKFSESCWRFTYYILAFTYGIVVLWDKSWFTDSNECWIGYPFQTITPGMYWYYMIEMGFYCSLMVSQFKDVKRKDFWQMFTHHVCTLALMTFSWIDNMVRMGTLVLVIHDAVDFWMEAAKMANYCKMHRTCNIIFSLFTGIWFVTRLVLYPYRVIYPTLFIASLNMDSFFAAYYLYNALLILLYFLHVFWFIFILKIAVKSLRHGHVEKDERSSSSETEETENSTTNSIKSNKLHIK